jgi:uridine kinase
MILIGICGGTGSGKSTLAKKLENHFKESKCTIILSDSYYKNNGKLNLKDRSNINYDHPESLDFNLLYENLKKLKQGIDIKEPIYSYNSHKRLKKRKLVLSKNIIIIEGLHIFCYKKIVDLIDLKIFLDVEDEIRLKRRIKRDVTFRGRSKKEILKRYVDMCKPMYDEHIFPSRKCANKILKTNDISLKNILNLIDNKFYDYIFKKNI